MQHPVILGSYNSAMGGEIYLSLSDNIEQDSMWASTIHETSHAWLTSSTLLGMLQNVMQMEMLEAVENNLTYSIDRQVCSNILVEYTKPVQEIYANNVELLAIEDQLGHEEMVRILKTRTIEYQNYYWEMNAIHGSGLSFHEKLQHTHELCVYAMNPPLPLQATTNAAALASSLQNEFNPYQRLKQVLADYIEHQTLPKRTFDEKAILYFLLKSTTYIKPYLYEAIENFDNFFNRASQQSSSDTIYEQLEKKICLFNPRKLQIKRSISPLNTKDRVFFVLKQVYNLLDPETFYIIGRNEMYLSEEISLPHLCQKVEQSLSVCMLISEYERLKKNSQMFDISKTLLTIIIQTSNECEQWLQREKENTLYISESYVSYGQTNVSLLFFCKRGEPQHIFVFPTLCEIRNRLLQKFGLESSCHHANEDIFWATFSYLTDEIGYLKYMRELLPILFDRSLETIQHNALLRPLISSIELALSNQAFRIKSPDYYKIMAALPPKDICRAPLFTLMRFQGSKNTGDTYLHEKFQAPLIFLTKVSADRFASLYASEYAGAGIDQVYWPIFYEMVRNCKGNVLLILDTDKKAAKLMSIDEMSEKWYT